MAERVGTYQWRITQGDVERVRVTEDLADRGTGVEFTPEGACGPVRFYFDSRCGMQTNPSVGMEFYDRRMCRMGGGMVMTHEQARRLLAFLKAHEHLLDDPEPKVGDVQEFILPTR